MIHFTKHALEKFSILKRHGFTISRHAVINVVTHPEFIDHSRIPLMIAQSNFDSSHVLRVVYKQEGDTKVIITFYPGRRNQYAKK